MNILKRIIGGVLVAAVAFSVLGCSKKDDNKISDLSDLKVGYQTEMPKEGEEIAVMTTNMGQIKIRFFPEIAPKAVENFKTHSKDGYYNGVIFHRVIEDFMIQSGDPNGNGTGGESIWGGSFEDEFSDKLFNITGSLSMANAGPNTNGSQFFINNVAVESFRGWDYFQQVYDIYKSSPSAFESRYGGTVDMSKVNDEIKALYEKYSGNPSLDGGLNTAAKGHTVFGQVFEGMDVVDKISKVDTNSADKPLSDITIEKIEITSYSK